ncbi:roadblock/LC7 domain-containing protein [Streptomyces sp. NPDC006430]|uniref:roadblock/LC7 domain-containing protein n=1 Tax=Streptomyces sp. NPDC006430 TaxID=3154299 RepID=UPI0033BBE72A
MTIKSDELTAEMRALRDRVVGVTDVVVASADGLLITAEADDTVDGECLAALTAAALSIARRAGTATGKGLVHHTVARFSDGYLVAQAIGDMALMAVLGDSGMDVKRFHAESQASADRIGLLLTSATGTTSVG